MSGTIRVLDPGVIGRIAAGESVSRPAAIVKELVENSLDAGATRVEVIIANGGRTLIQVSDDGAGMSPEDLSLCVLRHATSKITTFEDLCEALTYGFRGEALASVAAVSSLDIMSGHGGEGSHLRFLNGEARISPAPHHPGTRVRVRDLFKEIPARLKFLRSDRSEALGVLSVMKAAALSRPDISVFLREQTASGIRDLLSAPAETEPDRVRRVMGEGFVDTSLDVSAEGAGMAIRGRVATPRGFRSVMGDYHLFLNGRPIRSAEVTAAVRGGIGPRLPSDKHAPYVLFLTVPPREVDVNVHPTKAEARFRDPEAVCDLVRSAVLVALGQVHVTNRTVLPAAKTADEAETFAMVRIGDWQVFSTDAGIYAFSRAVAAERVLRSSERVDLPSPVILGFAMASGVAERLGRLGFEVSDFGGGTTAISAVPAGVEADPKLLAAALRPGSGEAEVLDWAQAGISDAVMMAAGREAARPVPVPAFEKMMRRS